MAESTPFARRVRALVRSIPRGKVASYGQVARMAGNPRGARGVGFIMMQNREADVPCHRVVHQDGSLCPGFGPLGLDLQRKLLESEGVSFCGERVDMQACRWDGEGVKSPFP